MLILGEGTQVRRFSGGTYLSEMLFLGKVPGIGDFLVRLAGIRFMGWLIRSTKWKH